MHSDLFKPTYLKTLCSQFGIKPSKKYGQNYLITDAPIKKMVEAAGVGSRDTVIEIGPGFGVLTFALLTKAKKLIAFEIEQKLKPYWESELQERTNFEIVWGNALQQLTMNNEQFTSTLGKYKVVANLPYQITSNVLRTLLELENKPESLTVMVQKEVAERICAKPGDMSLLAVSVQYFGQPKIITKVSSGCFWPAPKVNSAVLHINIATSKHKNIASLSDEEFFAIVRAGFINKRKQLAKNLAAGLKKDEKMIREILGQVLGNEKVRAQELNVEQWKLLIKQLSTSM